MRKTLTTLLVAGLMLPLGLATSDVHAVNIGNEGCTPGYWKNHTDNWFEDAAKQNAIPTTARLGALGLVPLNHSLAGTTLLEALNFRPRGDAEKILLRAAAAAYLNAAHEGLGYPYRRNQTDDSAVGTNFVGAVLDAIASGDRDAQLALKDILDAANNLGCPLN